MNPSYTHPCRHEALNFIASRLVHFKRIYYPWLCELITERYGIDQPAHLFTELIEDGAATFENGMMTMRDHHKLATFICEVEDRSLVSPCLPDP